MCIEGPIRTRATGVQWGVCAPANELILRSTFGMEPGVDAQATVTQHVAECILQRLQKDRRIALVGLELHVARSEQCTITAYFVKDV